MPVELPKDMHGGECEKDAATLQYGCAYETSAFIVSWWWLYLPVLCRINTRTVAVTVRQQHAIWSEARDDLGRRTQSGC